MPKIPINKVLSHLTEEEFATLKAITKNDFTLKANPPTLKHTISYVNGLKRKTIEPTVGKQVYLWKAVAYNLSPYMKDMAAPPLWKTYLTNGDDAVRLDEIAGLILEYTPKEFHYGIITRGEKAERRGYTEGLTAGKEELETITRKMEQQLSEAKLETKDEEYNVLCNKVNNFVKGVKHN